MEHVVHTNTQQVERRLFGKILIAGGHEVQVNMRLSYLCVRLSEKQFFQKFSIPNSRNTQGRHKKGRKRATEISKTIT